MRKLLVILSVLVGLVFIVLLLLGSILFIAGISHSIPGQGTGEFTLQFTSSGQTQLIIDAPGMFPFNLPRLLFGFAGDPTNDPVVLTLSIFVNNTAGLDAWVVENIQMPARLIDGWIPITFDIPVSAAGMAQAYYLVVAWSGGPGPMNVVCQVQMFSGSTLIPGIITDVIALGTFLVAIVLLLVGLLTGRRKKEYVGRPIPAPMYEPSLEPSYGPSYGAQPPSRAAPGYQAPKPSTGYQPSTGYKPASGYQPVSGYQPASGGGAAPAGKTCMYCGKPVDASAFFCPHCYAKLR